MKILALFISFCLTTQSLWSASISEDKEDFTYYNQVKKSTIHTVQITPKGWNLAYPVIELNGKNQIELSFDDFNEEVIDYSYRIIHCNSDWTSSNLSEFDYLDGFTENQIQDYELSFNSNYEFVHYKLSLPNNDVRMKISGNYVVEVYEEFDPEKVILSQRFSVVEPLVDIRGMVKNPVVLDLRETHQEVDFSILHDRFAIDNPQMDLKVVLTQNNRWDHSQKNLKPLFIRQNELVFDYQTENLFPGGNEYRYFDIKSLRYQSRFIQAVHKNGNQYQVVLFPGENRHFKHYLYEPDINGRFLIDVQERDDPATEADYAWVAFTLPMETPMQHGKFYVYGQLSQYMCREKYEMKYNFERKAYELNLLLKQGFYNYQYAFLEKGKKAPDLTFAEGSHRETENDYVIYVYYHDLAKNYDRLIGWQVINSLKPIH
ncbi:MAG: DUF5103 domain-containing protein [Marinifilaceae bacterium]